MAGKRVLILGVTGIDRRSAIARLAKWCETKLFRKCTQIDFERDWLFAHPRRVKPQQFLDESIEQQNTYWTGAWDDLWKAKRSEIEGENDTFLGMHGCYIRGHYGCRWVLDVAKVADFNPDLIVTLIGDVYDLWWRTESRAKGKAYRGQPTLEHLILGRRVEAAIGDQIALFSKSKPRHLVLAASHPCSTVAHCIYNPSCKVVYLSFPISQPRRMARGEGTSKTPTESGIDDVSNFIRAAYERQRNENRLACVCPLSIDELPLTLDFTKDEYKATATIDTPEGEKQVPAVKFDRAKKRWDLDKFWPKADRLCLEPDQGGPLIRQQIEDAKGNISTDLSWRDYRLAGQSDALAVFCPVFDNRQEFSSGVAQEIDFANLHFTPVFVYQDPRHDQSGFAKAWRSQKGGGTMVSNPSGSRIILCDSIDKMFDSILED